MKDLFKVIYRYLVVAFRTVIFLIVARNAHLSSAIAERDASKELNSTPRLTNSVLIPLLKNSVDSFPGFYIDNRLNRCLHPLVPRFVNPMFLLAKTFSVVC